MVGVDDEVPSEEANAAVSVDPASDSCEGSGGVQTPLIACANNENESAMTEFVATQTVEYQMETESVARHTASETPILEYLELLSTQEIVSSDAHELSTLEQMDMAAST